MKKPVLSLLIVITCTFSAFTLGFFLGRNQNHETVYLSDVPAAPSHNLLPESTSSINLENPEISFPVNINSADLNALSSLPGIGEKLANRIISYRLTNGPFEKTEELMLVEGIGAGKLEAILNYITTGE